jgi:L-rhamnose mutarotase
MYDYGHGEPAVTEAEAPVRSSLLTVELPASTRMAGRSGSEADRPDHQAPSERREEYLALHAGVWPGVEAAPRCAHVRNYSVFRHHDVLFAYFEYDGEDFEADMATIAADPVNQQWWKITGSCQGPWPDRGTGASGRTSPRSGISATRAPTAHPGTQAAHGAPGVAVRNKVRRTTA